MKSFRYILLFLSVSAGIYAQDSIPVTAQVLHNRLPVTGFASAAEYNPAAMAYTLRTNLSELYTAYSNQSGDAGLLQTGTAFDELAVAARSYMQTGKHHIWGSASYRQTHTDNVRWNESSDYLNVYPYVFADSVGGNNLSGERYSFMGGYAQKLNRLAWGVQFDYWALMEYRSVDPRPNNNTSNLAFTAGLSYKLTSTYALGGGVMLRKYKQKNTLAFYNVLGRPSIHHMTGMGTDAYLFANDDTPCLFNGSGYGVNVQLLPVSGMGWTGTLSYENFAFDKQLNNTQMLVLSDIAEGKYLLDLSWLREAGIHTFGAKLKASYTNRQGTEGKFTRNDNGTLINISSEKQYRNEQTVATLTLVYQHQKQRATWYVLPYASYLHTNESHKSSQRSMMISRIDWGITPGLAQSVGKHLISIDARVGYIQALDSKLELTGLSPQRSITQTLQANYDYLSSNGLQGALSARFDYSLPRNQTALYLKASWDYRKYDTTHSSLLVLQLGVSF